MSHPESPPPDAERVGNYVLVRRIGSGAMGEVWLGHHVVSGGLGAVKRLPPQARLRQQLTAYFVREGRAVARLAHPHVVPVFEVGDDYLVSAYVDGPNLARLLHTPIEPAEALRIARQIADALIHAHDRGVVHRDVKPSNILIDGQRNAYLADFGLAQLLGEDDESAHAAGTPMFMAPEQRRRGLVGPAVDQYALGRTMLEMLVGSRVPVQRDAALAELPAHLPRTLLAAVSRATAADPVDRFPSMRDFASVLADIELGAAAPPRRLAAMVREPTPFGWLAGAHRTVAASPEIERGDYRIRDLAGAGLLRTASVDAFLRETGLRDVGFALWASSPRLGSIRDPAALARASDLVVLMHGFGGTREWWAPVAAAVCRDNARAVVAALDLHGIGESPFAAVPSLHQASIPAIGRVVEGWRRLLGLSDIPTALVGHSMSALALLQAEDEAGGAQISRIAISPPLLLIHDAASRRRVAPLVRAAASLVRLGPVRRLAIRRLWSAPETSNVAPEIVELAVEALMQIPGSVLARIIGAMSATPEAYARQRRVALITCLDDPLTPPALVERIVAAVGIPSPMAHRLETGGHYPYVASRHNPEWQARNLADIVRVIDSMLITAAEPNTTLPTEMAETHPAGADDTHAR